jgi:hypothetical protein
VLQSAPISSSSTAKLAALQDTITVSVEAAAAVTAAALLSGLLIAAVIMFEPTQQNSKRVAQAQSVLSQCVK